MANYKKKTKITPNKKLSISLPILITIFIAVFLTMFLQGQNKSNVDPNLNPIDSTEGTNNNQSEEQTMETINLGDLMLYNGDQLTLHYGSNKWSYTRLGHIDMSADELRQILGDGDVKIVLSLK